MASYFWQWLRICMSFNEWFKLTKICPKCGTTADIERRGITWLQVLTQNPFIGMVNQL